MIPGYADGILEEPIPLKPKQRSQSNPIPGLNTFDDGSFAFPKDNVKDIVLPSTDLLAPDFAPPAAVGSDSFFNSDQTIPSADGVQDITGFSQNGPIEITDTAFAPRPSDGLLPPKDDSEVSPIPESVFTSPRPSISTNSIFDSSVTRIPGKYSGGFVSGVLPPNNNFGAIPQLGHDLLPPLPSQEDIPLPRVSTPTEFSVPSIDLLAPKFDPSQSDSEQELPKIPIKPVEIQPGKYQGGFGGAPGVLGGSMKPVQTITTTTVLPISSPKSTLFSKDQSTQTQSKFDRIPTGFGGPAGILTADNKQALSRGPNDLNKKQNEIPQIQTDLTAPFESSQSTYNRRNENIQFGGAPGILVPFDNKKS